MARRGAVVGGRWSGANPLRTGFESWRIAKAIYFVPLLFCYTPILFEGELWRVIETAIAALLGLLAFAAASEGFHLRPLTVLHRVLFFIAAALLLWPLWKCHAIGAAILLVLTAVQRRSANR